MAAKQQGPGLRYDSRTINQVHFEMIKRSNEKNRYSVTVKSNDEAKGTQQLHSKGILNKGVFSTLRKNKGGGNGEDGGSGGGALSDGGGGLSPLHLPSLAQTVSMSGWQYLNKKTDGTERQVKAQVEEEMVQAGRQQKVAILHRA
ncbi:hypothetical protein QOT17_001717 [Balamuthia mandrillaris]